MSKRFIGVKFIETVRDGETTYAFGVYKDRNVGSIPFAGSSVKNPEDKENRSRAESFAIGRALENLGKELQRREWKKFKRAQTKRKIEKKIFTEIEIAALRKAARDAKKNSEAGDKANKKSPKTSKGE